MNLKFFIDRPVLSAVISVVIMLLGAIGLASLPIEQYPEIAPPTIQVYTQYPGANAETVQKAVIVPLEEAINGVEGLNYITSTASNSSDVTINIYFKQKTDPDMAAVNVQNRVSKALGLLPAEVTKIGVTTEKQQNAELKTFALYAPEDKYDRQFLNNYLKINVEPRIKRVSGVGNVMQLGSNYSMRIWLKPDKMAQYKLVPSDISAVLANQNIEAATGQFGENHDNAHQYTMKYRGRLSQPDEFENLVVRSLPNGEVLRLKEVADIELGDEAYNYNVTLNGHPAANATSYPKLIKALRESLGKTKLITVTITGDPAGSLASEAAGIRAGEYIDYAWTWVNTKIMNPWEDSSIEKPIAGLDKSQYGGFSTDEYTFDYENDESYPETLREKLYDKGLGKLYIMRNIPFWSDALEATPYHANINAGAAAFYRVEGGHKYEPDINYLHNGKYKDMNGDKNYYEM